LFYKINMATKTTQIVIGIILMVCMILFGYLFYYAYTTRKADQAKKEIDPSYDTTDSDALFMASVVALGTTFVLFIGFIVYNITSSKTLEKAAVIGSVVAGTTIQGAVAGPQMTEEMTEEMKEEMRRKEEEGGGEKACRGGEGEEKASRGGEEEGGDGGEGG
jgi:uncharacterized membrane protein YgcG